MKNAFFNSGLSQLPFLPSVREEIMQRNRTNSPPQLVVISGALYEGAFSIHPSLDLLRIKLPLRHNPELFAWPVRGLVVVLINVGECEYSLKRKLMQDGAAYIEIYDEELESFNLYPQIDSALMQGVGYD